MNKNPETLIRKYAEYSIYQCQSPPYSRRFLVIINDDFDAPIGTYQTLTEAKDALFFDAEKKLNRLAVVEDFMQRVGLRHDCAYSVADEIAIRDALLRELA